MEKDIQITKTCFSLSFMSVIYTVKNVKPQKKNLQNI